jgi:hypothetical protein
MVGRLKLAIETCAAVRSAAAMNAFPDGDQPADHQRHAGVAAFANRLINRNAPRNGIPKSPPSARRRRTEDVGFMMAVAADEVAHVLDDPERRDVQLHAIAIARRVSASDTAAAWSRRSRPPPAPSEAERNVAGPGGRSIAGSRDWSGDLAEELL